MNSDDHSHPPLSQEVDLDKAVRIDQKGKEQKFTVKVEIPPSTSQGVANPLWCIIWQGNPLVAIASYHDNTEDQDNKEVEFYFSSYPPPLYITHWEQVGKSMLQMPMKEVVIKEE